MVIYRSEHLREARPSPWARELGWGVCRDVPGGARGTEGAFIVLGLRSSNIHGLFNTRKQEED